MHQDIRWIDHGPDNYAGVTWSGVDDRALFIGWMSNWEYANKVPTRAWRNAMTLPRSLSLAKTDAGYRLLSLPVRELEATDLDLHTRARQHGNRTIAGGSAS